VLAVLALAGCAPSSLSAEGVVEELSALYPGSERAGQYGRVLWRRRVPAARNNGCGLGVSVA